MGVRTSAGLLLWRRPAGTGGPEVLLGHPGGPFYARKDDGHWSVPKGEYVAGEEEPLAAAYREFAEEIGVEPPAGDPVPLGEAPGARGKVNTVWALAGDLDVTEIAGNTFTLEWPPRSGRQREFPELDRAGWFDLDAARIKIAPAQRVFLDRLAEVVGHSGRPADVGGRDDGGRGDGGRDEGGRGP